MSDDGRVLSVTTDEEIRMEDEIAFWERVYFHVLDHLNPDPATAKRVAEAALAARRAAFAPTVRDGKAILAELTKNISAASREVDFIEIPYDDWQAIADYLEPKGVRPIRIDSPRGGIGGLQIVTRHGFRTIIPGAK